MVRLILVVVDFLVCKDAHENDAREDAQGISLVVKELG
jgi:hypothetical protein